MQQKKCNSSVIVCENDLGRQEEDCNLDKSDEQNLRPKEEGWKKGLSLVFRRVKIKRKR